MAFCALFGREVVIGINLFTRFDLVGVEVGSNSANFEFGFLGTLSFYQISVRLFLSCGSPNER